jgi:hypothetical protein
MESLGTTISSLIFLVVMVGLYFVPSIVAHKMKRRQVLPIFVLNLCLGWTILGWVAALVWALIEEKPPVAPVIAPTVPTPIASGRCPSCGGQISEGARFCAQCGTTLIQQPALVLDPVEALEKSAKLQATQAAFDKKEKKTAIIFCAVAGAIVLGLFLFNLITKS